MAIRMVAQRKSDAAAAVLFSLVQSLTLDGERCAYDEEEGSCDEYEYDGHSGPGSQTSFQVLTTDNADTKQFWDTESMPFIAANYWCHSDSDGELHDDSSDNEESEKLADVELENNSIMGKRCPDGVHRLSMQMTNRSYRHSEMACGGPTSISQTAVSMNELKRSLCSADWVQTRSN